MSKFTPPSRSAPSSPRPSRCARGGSPPAGPVLGAFVALVLSSGCSSCGAKGEDGRVAHLDLLAHLHLADFAPDGLFVAFGTPAQDKYTMGDWGTGFGTRGADGTRTFARVGRRGRLYLPLDAQNDYTARLVLRPRGTGAMTPYLNNQELKSLFFDGDEFQAVEFALPKDHVQAGENYLLLAFGDTTALAGEDVSVELASLELRAGLGSSERRSPAPPRAVSSSQQGEESTVTAAGGLSWYLTVPPDASLELEVATAGEETRAKVTAERDGSDAVVLFEETVQQEPQTASVDLAAFTGDAVRLRFEAVRPVTWRRARVSIPRRVRERALVPAKYVVVLLVDTLRADKLKPFNPGTRVQTPVLDALAEDSVVFERAHSPENWTKPSVASILTGLYPVDHGARTQAAVLPDSAWLVSEHFKRAGRATAAFIGNGYVSDRFGFKQGWDTYRNFIRDGGSTEAKDIFAQAAHWVNDHKDKPFFLYVHTIDPHVPYDPPPEFVALYDPRTDYDGQVKPRSTGDLLHDAKRNPPRVTFTPSDAMRLEALHDGEISQHDKELGVFIQRLKDLGIWEDTAFVLVSDHGEEFNEHGSWGHGHSIYEELLHVPLLVHRAGMAPRRVSQAVSTMDIAPTVADLAGIEPLPNVAAKSLVPLLFGEPRPGPAVAMSDFQEERRVMVTEKFKFFVRGNLTASVFNLGTDPGETQQLAVDAFPIASRNLRILLGQFLGAKDRGNWLAAEQAQGQRLRGGSAHIDDQLEDQLEQLGYHVDE